MRSWLVRVLHGGGDPCTPPRLWMCVCVYVCGWRGLLSSKTLSIITRITATASYAPSSSSSSPSHSPAWRGTTSQEIKVSFNFTRMITRCWRLMASCGGGFYSFYALRHHERRRWACSATVCSTLQLRSILWIGSLKSEVVTRCWLGDFKEWAQMWTDNRLLCGTVLYLNLAVSVSCANWPVSDKAFFFLAWMKAKCLNKWLKSARI